MSKSWAEMTDQERWEHSQRWDTDWHRNNPNPSGDVLDFVNQQAGNITVTQPSEFLQAMAGDDVVENRLYTSSPALDPKSNYAETQTAAQNIQNSGANLVSGNQVYNTGNSALNEAIYGNDIANNLTWDNQGWETPRQFQTNQSFENAITLAGLILGGGIGGGAEKLVTSALGDAFLGPAIGQLASAGTSMVVKDEVGELGEAESLPEIAWQLPDVSDQLGDLQVQIPDFSLPNEGGGGEPAGGGANSNSQIEDPSFEPSAQPEFEEEGELTTGGLINPWPDGWNQILNPDGSEIPYEEDDVYIGDGTEQEDYIPSSLPIINDTTTQWYNEDGTPYLGGMPGQTGSTPAYNGMGPDGTQAGAGTGTGAGGGSGSGNGDGDGDGDGDGNESGSGGGAGGGAGRVSDAEWGELFPYTKLTPAQKTALLPHIDYIRSIRG